MIMFLHFLCDVARFMLSLLTHSYFWTGFFAGALVFFYIGVNWK